MTRRRKILGSLALVLLVAVVAFGVALSHDSPCRSTPALTAGAATMKAVVHRCYGPSETLKVEDVEKPVPAADEVLVKVRAAAVNALDWHYLRGKPYIMRIASGFGRPKDPYMGVDFAGVVEAVGADVKTLRVGDEVFGGKWAAFAEYLTARETLNVIAKPANVSFEEAAGVPVAAVTALQAMRDKGKLKAGEKLLVNGASGGVGTYAVQIGKALGAEVTAVCSTRNVETAKSLGADHVVDYQQQDFTQGGVQYDVIIDIAGNRDMSEYRKILTEQGRYVMVGGPNEGDWLGPMSGALKANLYSPFVSQEFSFMLARVNRKDLELLRDLMASGKLTTVIDRRFPLAEAAAAVAYVEVGHARGKVIITMQ